MMNARIIKRRVGALGCAGTMAAVLFASSCAQILGIEELRTGFEVRGTATGVLGPVKLELRSDVGIEIITVREAGPFVFDEIRLNDGASYIVMLADPSIPCVLRNNVGMIAGADTAIELTCTGASLASLVVSGIAPTVELVPDTTEYAVDLPLLQQSVTVTATVATPGDTLSIAATAVASGEPSAEIPLDLGENQVDIVVENHFGWEQTYRVMYEKSIDAFQAACRR